MKLHILQHVYFEGPGYIAQWAQSNGAEISYTRFYEGSYSFPEPSAINLLVILGGPMSVNDSAFTPWMQDEMAFINQCLTANVPVFGICLGAQLIAGVLGAKITAAANKEIGWYPVKNIGALNEWPWYLFKNQPVVFHWHGEQFEIPKNTTGNLVTDANTNQGFLYGDRVIGLQFHLEATADSVADLLNHASDDLTGDAFVQTKEYISSHVSHYMPQSNTVLRHILDYLTTI